MLTKIVTKRDGINRLTMRCRTIAERTDFEVVSALDEVGKDLKEKSQAVVLYDPAHDPEDGPHLRDTAYYGVFMERLGPALEVGYTSVYALRRHEELDVTPTTPGTGPKFLELPWLANRGRYVENVKDAGRSLLHG